MGALLVACSGTELADPDASAGEGGVAPMDATPRDAGLAPDAYVPRDTGPAPECRRNPDCLALHGPGYECSREGVCEFDADAPYDVYLCDGQADLPLAGVGYMDAPDLFWLMRYEAGGDWSESTILEDVDALWGTWDQRVELGATAEALQTGFYVQLWDDDSGTGGDGLDDLVGACNLAEQVDRASFDGRVHRFECEASGDAGGYAVWLAFVLVGAGPPTCE